jgi:hypothetical protein
MQRGMKRNAWVALVVALFAVVYVARHLSGGSGTIDYCGQTFKTAKKYWSYEAYKDDPNNLDTNELARIEKVMTEASLPPAFNSRKEFIHAMFELKFPGYGLGGIGDRAQTDDGSELTVESVEIPQRDKESYVVVRESTGRLIVLDDFVHGTATNAVRHVKLEANKLKYFDDKGALVREKQL